MMLLPAVACSLLVVSINCNRGKCQRICGLSVKIINYARHLRFKPWKKAYRRTWKFCKLIDTSVNEVRRDLLDMLQKMQNDHTQRRSKSWYKTIDRTYRCHSTIKMRISNTVDNIYIYIIVLYCIILYYIILYYILYYIIILYYTILLIHIILYQFIS